MMFTKPKLQIMENIIFCEEFHNTVILLSLKDLRKTGNTDTGIWLTRYLESPPLYKGITLAIFSSFGKIPCNNDMLQTWMSHILSLKTSTQALNILYSTPMMRLHSRLTPPPQFQCTRTPSHGQSILDHVDIWMLNNQQYINTLHHFFYFSWTC